MRRKELIPFEDIQETHPWDYFPKSSGDNKSKKLIIGSFPPNKFTSHRERMTRCDMDFFYGSKDNAFWELFAEALRLNVKLPDELDCFKNWISKSEWIVTDIVKKTKRRNDTAFDSDLIIEQWNTETILSIFNQNAIEQVFFTSHWVKQKFEKVIKPEIDTRKIEDVNLVTLLSPSRNGLRSAKRAGFTIIKAHKGESSKEYRKRYYAECLKYCTTANK